MKIAVDLGPRSGTLEETRVAERRLRSSRFPLERFQASLRDAVELGPWVRGLEVHGYHRAPLRGEPDAARVAERRMKVSRGPRNCARISVVILAQALPRRDRDGLTFAHHAAITALFRATGPAVQPNQDLGQPNHHEGPNPIHPGHHAALDRHRATKPQTRGHLGRERGEDRGAGKAVDGCGEGASDPGPEAKPRRAMKTTENRPLSRSVSRPNGPPGPCGPTGRQSLAQG